MKSAFKSVVKDNIATAAVLAATFIAIIGGVVDGTDVFSDPTVAQLPTQRMETITVTAPRETLILLDAIVITASRDSK